MKSVVFVLTVLAGIATAQQGAPRVDIQQILSPKVPHYSIRATNLLQAAGQIASDFDLPMGVEWQGDTSAAKEISATWDNVTVEHILYDTAAFDVEYHVWISNGVVHLSKAGLVDNDRNPLNIKLPSFAVADEYTHQAALKLRDQVNLMIFPRQKPFRAACAGSYGVGAGEVRVTLHMTNAEIRDILDALLRRSQFSMWLVVFRNEQPDTGFLKTKSPWRNTTDLEQPDLDLISPYDDPVTGLYRGDWKMRLER